MRSKYYDENGGKILKQEKVTTENIIRPTRTSMLNTNSKHFSMNSSNFGGRHLMNQLSESHYKNLASSKKMIDNGLPWSHQEQHFNRVYKNHPLASKLSPVKQRKSPPKKQRKSISSDRSARKSTASSCYQPNSASSVTTSSFKLDPLSQLRNGKQQEIYQEFVNLLSEIGQDASQYIAQAACIDAEENLLLQDFRGVSNYFDDMISEDIDQEEDEEGESDADLDNILSQEEERDEELAILRATSAAITEEQFA